VNGSVWELPELATVAVFGVMSSGFGPVMVNVAATVVPAWSLTVSATFVDAVTAPAGTVTVNELPLDATFQVPFPAVPLKATAGLLEITVYPGTPSKIVKVAVPPVTPLTDCVPGCTQVAR